jgi:putative transposase
MKRKRYSVEQIVAAVKQHELGTPAADIARKLGIAEQTWLAYRHVILINHSTGLGRKWWDEIGRGIVNPEFANLIDEMLVDAAPDDTYKRMATWGNE